MLVVYKLNAMVLTIYMCLFYFALQLIVLFCSSTVDVDHIQSTFTFTFSHFADAFIQSDLAPYVIADSNEHYVCLDYNVCCK